MKKIFKTFAVLAAVAALGFGFVSCASDDDNGGSSGGGNGGGGNGGHSVTLHFDKGIPGNSVIGPQYLKTGEKATRPKDLVYDGYIFDNWYTNKEFTTVFDFDTPITTDKSDVTVYAKWTLDPSYVNNWTLEITVNDSTETVSNDIDAALEKIGAISADSTIKISGMIISDYGDSDNNLRKIEGKIKDIPSSYTYNLDLSGLSIKIRSDISANSYLVDYHFMSGGFNANSLENIKTLKTPKAGSINTYTLSECTAITVTKGTDEFYCGPARNIESFTFEDATGWTYHIYNNADTKGKVSDIEDITAFVKECGCLIDFNHSN